MSTDLALIRERRKAISSEIERLSGQITILQAELPDLEIAERVLALLVGDGGNQTGEADQPMATEGGGGKPSNTPTTPKMILSLLREAKQQGKRGLEPREMLILITKRWWPTVKSEDVAPTAWRMWKEGRLKKDGSLYMLPENTVAADLTLRDGPAAPEF